jgi:MinD-like ATPase involved in chromosome partitioning or flagellar assembly
MVGKIITFYSYKGGVGRSMAMANVAVILAKWGYKTLVVDWDLEAPGLENFYSDLINPEVLQQKKGLIDILEVKTKQPEATIKSINWKDFYSKIPLEGKSLLHFMNAGKRDDDYVSKVRNFDYNSFYTKADGGEYIEDLRDFWIENYDFILIDSRTGLTDSSGMCSIHMPDVLLLLFTPNIQSFNGIKNVSKKAKEAQAQLIYDRFRLRTLPVVTRIENAETKLLDDWLSKIAEESEEMFDWIPVNMETHEKLIAPFQVINQTKVPYKSLYAYGESLPAHSRGTADPLDIGYVYETIAAVIANNLENVHMLIDSRDNFIKKAKGEIIPETVLQEKIVENETKNDILTKQLQEKEEEKLKLIEERKRIRRIAIPLAVMALIVAGSLLYQNSISNRLQVDKTDSLSNVVTTIQYKNTADSLAGMQDSIEADRYYVKAATHALQNNDTAKAINILKDASKQQNLSVSQSSKQLDDLLKNKYDNVYKVDFFYTKESSESMNKNQINSFDIANEAVNSAAKINNVIAGIRTISDDKQKHYKYTGEFNEIRYEKGEEKLAYLLADNLNSLPYFRDNNIAFKAIKMTNSESYHYLSVFIQNQSIYKAMLKK